MLYWVKLYQKRVFFGNQVVSMFYPFTRNWENKLYNAAMAGYQNSCYLVRWYGENVFIHFNLKNKY